LKNLTKNTNEGCRLGHRSNLGGRRTCKKTYYKTVREKIAKRIVGFLSEYDKTGIGPCGGDDPLRNGKRNFKQRRNR
jgi:hypothetical protein